MSSKAKNYLSIIADIFAILGVSVIGVIGRPMISIILEKEISITDFLSAILFYSIYITLLILILYFLLKRFKLDFSEKKYFIITSRIILVCLLLVVYLGSFSFAIDYWGNIFNNKYFYPDPPSTILKQLDINFQYSDSEIRGKIDWNSNINNSDYKIVTYVKYSNNSEYRIHNYDVHTHSIVNSTNTSNINIDNTFVIPAPSKLNIYRAELDSIILAVVTKHDCLLVKRYPASVFDSKDSTFGEINAYTQTLKL